MTIFLRTLCRCITLLNYSARLRLPRKIFKNVFLTFGFSDKNIIFVAGISLSKQNCRAMNIENKLTDGCDMASRVYSNMFNILEEAMLDREKLKELSPLDFSALGLYIGKFVEQEINSSVVQIMRAFRGVPMPQYYCRRFRRYTIDPVYTERQTIYLNSWIDPAHQNTLKSIPLGDAYCALEQLKREDYRNFFKRYPWLSEPEFLDAWLDLSRFRNRMAHIGEIIDMDTLRENYDAFQVFLKYMPDMNMAKQELAPSGFQQSLITVKKRKEIIVGEKDEDLFIDSKPFAEEKCEIPDKAKKFKLRKGKRGLKDPDGNIIVPAKYDDFSFLPDLFLEKRESVVAIRDGRKVLVALDGSGRELTRELYDDIRLADSRKKDSPYVYLKNKRRLWGIMDDSGRELCDNIIEDYICKTGGLWYESGELWGYWNYGEGKPFLPPIFDNIEIVGKPSDPLLFTLKDVQGYVEVSSDSYRFIPMADLDKMDKETRKNTLNNCI